MSKVKFIQWGTDAKPKQYEERWNVDELGSITESSVFTKVKEDYKGGIIFVTYLDAKDKITQEIWANGVQYSVGGGGGGNVIYGSVAPNSQGVVEDMSGDKTIGAEGYIYVYTTSLKQTAYYWTVDNTLPDGGKWSAFEVDAEHVWFPNGVLRTERWGSAVTENSTPVAECTGKNLKELMEYYLVKEKFVASTVSRANTTAPTFTGSLTKSPTLEVDRYILLNATKTGKGTYYPTVSKNTGCVASGTLTFGPQTIVNNTGYKVAKTDEKYIAGNKVGNTVSVTASVGDVVQGSGAVTITVGSTLVASANYANTDTSKEVTWTIGTGTLGEYTAKLTATNSTTCTATYKNSKDENVSLVTIPGISTIYPVTNKGNIPATADFTNAQPNGINADGYLVPLSGSFPTSMTYTVCPTTTATYTVYLPIVGNMGSDAALGSASTELKKFYAYASGDTFSATVYVNGTNPGDGNNSRYYFEFPSAYLAVSSLSDGQSTLTKGTHYKVESTTTKYGEQSYTRVTILPGYKYAGVSNKAITVKFNKPS